MNICTAWRKGGAYDRCYATKEREACECLGNEALCDFYPEKRKKGESIMNNKYDYEIDCRKCKKLKADRSGCTIHGDDPEKAAKACAAKCFVDYECEDVPHDVAEVMCWECGERWIAAWPSETLLKDLECPECGSVGYAFLTGQTIKE